MRMRRAVRSELVDSLDEMHVVDVCLDVLAAVGDALARVALALRCRREALFDAVLDGGRKPLRERRAYVVPLLQSHSGP